MKKKINLIVAVIVLVTSFLITLGCTRMAEPVNCFPYSNINVQLNLNLPAYYALQNTGGWIYVNEQQSGTRGLIVVRTTTGFMVYDRNAPHICPENNTTLSVENDIKITCPKDGSEWILLTGQPVKTANIAPKMYTYTFDSKSNFLNIYN